MTDKVWSLLRLEADTEEELVDKYREVYVNEYVNQEIYDFKGNRVIFPYSQFDHAFTESKDYRYSLGIHDRFSKKRARYMLWIKKIILKDAGKVDYQFEYRSEVREKKGKRVVARIYAVVDEKYIVVLDKRDEKLYFVTGIPHDKNSFERMSKRSTLIKKEKIPSSFGD